jgi:hypothetical protein
MFFGSRGIVLDEVTVKAYLGFNLTTQSLDLVSIGWFTDASWGCVVFMKWGDLGVRKCLGCISEFNADINVGRLRSSKGWSLKSVPTFPVTVASYGEFGVDCQQWLSIDGRAIEFIDADICGRTLDSRRV